MATLYFPAISIKAPLIKRLKQNVLNLRLDLSRSGPASFGPSASADILPGAGGVPGFMRPLTEVGGHDVHRFELPPVEEEVSIHLPHAIRPTTDIHTPKKSESTQIEDDSLEEQSPFVLPPLPPKQSDSASAQYDEEFNLARIDETEMIKAPMREVIHQEPKAHSDDIPPNLPI